MYIVQKWSNLHVAIRQKKLTINWLDKYTIAIYPFKLSGHPPDSDFFCHFLNDPQYYFVYRNGPGNLLRLSFARS